MKIKGIIILMVILFGCKNNEPDKQLYLDKVFTNVLVDELIPYSDVDPTNQVMDVYQPSADNEVTRPILVIAGGGAFYPSDLNFLKPIATRLAQSGYVVAAIRYISDIDNVMDPTFRNLTGAQDINAAIRYFRKDAAGSNTYKIDVDNIFLGGFGTGAYLALQRAYITSADLDQATIDLINMNGGFEGERGNPGYSTETKAVVSMAGAVYDLNWIDAGELPVIAIQSTTDNEVPYGCGFNSKGTPECGSSEITKRADKVGLTNKLVPISGSNHDAPSSCESCFEEVLKFLYPFITK